MAKYIDWGKLILITVFCVLFCFGIKAQKKKIVRSGYYFIVQIERITKDTVYFKTIEIYSVNPLIKIKIDNDSILQYKQSDISKLLFNRSFYYGKIKNIKKREVGKLIVLNATLEDIEKSGYIHFDHPKKLRKLRFSELHLIPRE